MKKLTLLLFFFFNYSYAQVPGKAIITKADKLRDLYAKIMTEPDNDNAKQAFFNVFPATFKEFVNLYGYENDSPCILYYKAEGHVLGLFNNIKSVNDTLYYNKIIDIAIGGRWDADAVSYLQQGIRQHVLKNIDLTVYLLGRRSSKQMHSFWYFYFDGPHPERQVPAGLKKIRTLNKNMYAIILQEHQHVLNFWEND